MKKIKLTKEKWAIVDDWNYKKLNKFKWYFGGRGYAVRNEYINNKRKHILMHREILKPPLDLMTDHINHDRLDNRESNLRSCTKQENLFNQSKRKKATSSIYKGVFWRKIRKRWVARIQLNGKKYYLGTFKIEKDAANRYNEFAKELYGKYAGVNNITKGTSL